jgi:UDP-N-acetylmuramoylalanine--D-glutamate ligase
MVKRPEIFSDSQADGLHHHNHQHNSSGFMILPTNVTNKTYAVLGLGKSGLASARSLLKAGARVWAWDDSAAIRAEAVSEDVSLYDLTKADWSQVTSLVLSPGIPHTHPAPHPVVAAALTAGVPLTSDIQLLFETCPMASFIGITGTNGKSTTTALIGHILQSAGKRLQVGGNLGTPALSLAPLAADGIYVLELSSYQLELVQDNPPLAVGILLNITPDHLARHGGMAGYIAAKRRIFKQQGTQVAIIGMDDALTREVAEQVGRDNPALQIIGISADNRPECAIHVRDGQLIVAGEPVLSLSELTRLRGQHNWQNLAAAWAAAAALGLSRDEILAGLRSFAGLAHRQEWVAAAGAVQFINDSKATNAEATAKALVCYESIYWILGGQAKEGGLAGLEPFMGRIRHAFLIGQAAKDFAVWLADKVPFSQCQTLDIAVEQATNMALRDNLPDGTVLLSPACASWDQFRNFEERGELFRQLVKRQLQKS